MSRFKTRDPLRLYCALPVGPHIRRAFSRAGASPPDVAIAFTRSGNPPSDVLIERRGNRFTFVLEADCSRLFVRSMRRMVDAYAYWLSLADPERVNAITVNASDGDRVSNARFAPSVRLPGHVALPDPHFFAHLGFETERVRSASSALAWQSRSADLVWRGGANGNGWTSLAPEDAGNPAVVQRLRLVMLAQSLPAADIRLVALPAAERELSALARRTGLIGAPVPASSWLGRKYALDIDGYTNTWSNLLVRLLYGCCVLKVQSQFGYRQWYYDDLNPFEHYVPVRADMSDLAEKLDWVRSNDTQARAIAERGQALARTLTFESQARRAARLIEANAG